MFKKELAWTDFLQKKAPKFSGVLTGIGDDCALVKVGKEELLLKSDLSIEGVHFRRGKMSFGAIAQRAVCRVLSDFAACAARPKFIGISLGFPSSVKPKHLKQLITGVIKLSHEYKFSLVGGDTSVSKVMFLDVWGLGLAKQFISRSRAKKGDYIFLSGCLGKNKLDRPFEPKLNTAQYLVKKFKVNAMIDVSDGFIIDLYRILKMSHKGAYIQAEDLPLANGFSDLYRGEDYELIFTVDQSDENIALLKDKFFAVGRIEAKSFGYQLRRKNRLSKIAIRGYTHF